MHKIINIESGSIAQEMGLQPGDLLLTINGQKITDVLDYRFMVQNEEMLLEIKKPSSEIWELEIEKDEEEDLGLVFESALMADVHQCHNKCIFCFMDQLPKGMRQSLYFKDDDPRLSFLSGNYVTLTNLTETEADRIARYHLSPIHISVHAADPTLRRKMLNNKKAGDLFKHLQRFKGAGITLHFQIVLCKGVNDGPILDETIMALLDIATEGASLSVVPVGLTKYREGLYPLLPFSQEDAAVVINQVEKYHPFAYCADEWYIKAGISMPTYEYYGNFPQLENGVGMWTLFEQSFKKNNLPQKAGIVTGEAAQKLMAKMTDRVYVVKNDFFGHQITVSGLLTGRDIINQVKSARQDGCSQLLLPENMFRAGTECTLDDITREEIEKELGLPIHIVAV